MRVSRYLGEVRQELGRVAWPSRREVVTYSTVVLVATSMLTALVFAFDASFQELVIRLFG